MSYCREGQKLFKQWESIGRKSEWQHLQEELDAFAEFRGHVESCQECLSREAKERDENNKSIR